MSTEFPTACSPPAIRLHESCRQDGTAKKGTLANLSRLPDEPIEAVRLVLEGAAVIAKNLD